MKLAIAGKGGVGKTTLASLLAESYASEGTPVIAVDADPDANFAGALGIPAEVASQITPVAELKDLIEERTGAKPGGATTFFKLNPMVDDIPDGFSFSKGNIKLLVMGKVRRGGGGCMCPESTLVRALLSHLVLARSEVIIVDMEAGLEHLGRGTAQSVDAFIIVAEPGQRSIDTARAIERLAKDIGVRNCFVVGSKTRNESDHRFIHDSLRGLEVLGFIDYDHQILGADRQGLGVFDAAPKAAQQVREIKHKLDQVYQG